MATTESSPAPLPRLLTSVRFTLGAFGLFIYFVFNLGVGAIVHLDLPITRNAVARVLERTLNSTFQGDFEIGGIAHLAQDSVEFSDVLITDPSNRLAIQAKSLRAQLSPFDILSRILGSHEKLSIVISGAHADTVEVFLHPTVERDEAGERYPYPSLVETFSLVDQTTNGPETPPGRPVRVWLPTIQFTNVYARGSIAGSPTIEAHISEAKAKVLATENGATIDINSFALNASGILGVDTKAAGAVHVRAPGPVWGAIDGSLGDTQFHQSFRYEGTMLEIEGAFPEMQPESMRPLVGPWPLDRVVTLRNRVQGDFSTLKLDLEVSAVGPKRTDSPPLNIVGTATLAPTPRLDLRLDALGFDLSRFNSKAPSSDLDFDSQISLIPTDTGPSVAIEASLKRGLFAGIQLPAVDMSAAYESEEFSLDGKILEAGLTGKIHISKKKEDPYIFEALLPQTQLATIPYLRKYLKKVSGQAKVSLSGQLDGEQFDLKTELSIRDFRQLPIRIQHTNLEARWRGTTDQLVQSQIEFDIRTKNLGYRKIGLSSVRLAGTGSVLSPALELEAVNQKSTTLKATLIADWQRSTIRELSANVVGQGTPLFASAKKITFGSNHLAIADLYAKSIGELRGDIDVRNRKGTVKLQASRLDLSRLGKSLGLARSEFSGELSANVDLKIDKTAQGSAQLQITNGAYWGIENVEFSATSTHIGNAFMGTVDASVKNLGTLNGSWQTALSGSPTNISSYLGATGKVNLALKDGDLKTASYLIGKHPTLPTLEGSLNLSFSAARSESEGLPQLHVSASTKNLVAHFEKTTVRGVDVDFAASVPESGQGVHTALRIEDRKGPLSSLSGKIELPLVEWFRRLPSANDLKREIYTAPVNLVVHIPKRPMRSWPTYLPQPLEEGALEARFTVGGSLTTPETSIRLIGHQIQGGLSELVEPLDVQINARYMSSNGSLRGNIQADKKKRRIATAHFDINVPKRHFLSPPPAAVPLWTGSAQLLLESAPLHIHSFVNKSKLQGHAQGAIGISRTGLLPSIEGNVQIRHLDVASHHLGDAMIEVETHQNDLIARTELSDDFGILRATGEMGIESTSALFQPIKNRSIFLHLESDKYNAAVLNPLVDDIFDELSGNLNGKLRAELTPPQGKETNWHTTFSGSMELQEGIVSPRAFGARLQEISLQVTAKPIGDFNVVDVKHLEAKANSTTHNLKGDGKFFFKNLDLQHGQFRLSPKKVPFLVRGDKLADLTGEAVGRVQLRDEELNLELSMDDITANLMETSETNLIALDENPHIRVLQESKEVDKEIVDPGIPLNIIFRLGDNIRLRNSMIDMRIRGQPEMRVTEDVQVRGNIELVRGGRFHVMGRGFVLEPGNITFDTGDATNPHLAAAAAWTSPGGVVVRGSVRGTVQQPILEWTSDPALPGGEAEIIGLVLGSGGNMDQGNVGLSPLAIAANEAIGATGVRGLEIYMTQQDNSGEGRMASLTESNWESYTAAIRLSDELWFEGSLQKGTTGFHTDERSGVSGTLDWRFHPQWSARTEFGTLGAGLDLVWRYRY